MIFGKLSEYDRLHVAQIMAGRGSNFSAELLRLIAKADERNRTIISQVYPEHVAAYTRWMESDSFE